MVLTQSSSGAKVIDRCRGQFAANFCAAYGGGMIAEESLEALKRWSIDYEHHSAMNSGAGETSASLRELQYLKQHGFSEISHSCRGG